MLRFGAGGRGPVQERPENIKDMFGGDVAGREAPITG
jgi:hypothetical protein